MSSLSQEDLDAGWDEPERSAVPKAEPANAVSQSIPPNSITIEKSPAPLDSAIVRSAPDAEALADSNSVSAAPLLPPDGTLTGPPVVTSPAEEVLAQLAATSQEPVAQQPIESGLGQSVPESNTEVVGQPAESSHEQSTQATEAELVVRTPESCSEPVEQRPAESSLEQSAEPTEAELVVQPTEASPEPLARATDSNLEQTIPPVSGVPVSSSGASPAGSPDSQLELFTAVTEKPKLLALKGVDTGAEAEPIAAESAAEVPGVSIEVTTVEAPSALRAPDVVAAQDGPISHKSSVRPQASADLGVDEAAAVEVTLRSNTESYTVRHWRTIAIAAAAALFLVVGFLTIRSRHTQRDQPLVQSKIGDIQAQHVAPVSVPNPASTASEAAAVAKSAVPIGAPAPVRPAPATGAQAESFSDAFVKHAATANSSWADVKKRPKAIESSQVNKPNAASNAKANDNPLDVLDKLEKARKAKKSVAK